MKSHPVETSAWVRFGGEGGTMKGCLRGLLNLNLNLDFHVDLNLNLDLAAFVME